MLNLVWTWSLVCFRLTETARLLKNVFTRSGSRIQGPAGESTTPSRQSLSSLIWFCSEFPMCIIGYCFLFRRWICILTRGAWCCSSGLLLIKLSVDSMQCLVSSLTRKHYLTWCFRFQSELIRAYDSRQEKPEGLWTQMVSALKATRVELHGPLALHTWNGQCWTHGCHKCCQILLSSSPNPWSFTLRQILLCTSLCASCDQFPCLLPLTSIPVLLS